MQDELEQIGRRGFLKLGGAGLAAAGISALWPGSESSLAQEPGGVPRISLTDRVRPTHPVLLRSAQLEVALDPDDGLPWEYKLRATNAKLRGEDFGRKITATACAKESWRFFEVDALTMPLPATIHGNSTGTGPDAHQFAFAIRDGEHFFASFVLRYELDGATLTVTMHGVEEHEGYELISVHMPRLVTAREEDGAGWLVHGDSGGSWVNLNEAKPGGVAPNSFWGKIYSSLPVVMVGTDRMMCVQETTALMDTTEINVYGDGNKRRASMGSDKVNRVHGGECYNLNLGRSAPLNCGNRATPNLPVEERSSCRLDFLPVRGAAKDAWLDGARLIRARMPAIPKDFYHDKYMYGIRCDEPLFEKPTATFEECERLIADVAALTDRAPQIVHLWGWQFKGKDTGYPAVNVVDERIGGYDGMMRVMERGRAHNATVSLSDNYDDAYKSSPAWDDAMVARRPDGQLWQSRSWTGEVSWILGLAKYMEGPGVERVRYTCERYKLPYTSHVDVLSYYAIRNDWDAKRPASGIRNLREGRYRVLEEFAKYGVDITSEGLRYPMIGRMSCTWYAQTSESCPFGGKTIPLLPLVYGKSAIWGLSGGLSALSFELRARHLFWGAQAHEIVTAATDHEHITDVYYMMVVPWMHLHRRQIIGFERNGERVAITYEGLSRVEIDWEAKNYRVVLDGVEVASQDATYCPLDEERLCLYSTTTQRLSAALPSGWKVDDVSAIALSAETRLSVAVAIEAGRIAVQAQARQPVIVYRHRTT